MSRFASRFASRFVCASSSLVLWAAGIAACGSGDDTAAPPAKVDAGLDSGPTVDASLPPDGSGDAQPVDSGADGGDAGGPSYALFVGTDYTTAELSVVGLHPDAVAGRLPIADQDSVPYVSGGLGFVLEHTTGKALVLDPAQPWMPKSTIDTNDTPDASPRSSNPRAVLVTTGTKAYVARYASNVVKIVDVGSGAPSGTLDLSSFVAPDDTDGVVDVQDAVYDPSSHRAYFLLQRINQFDFSGSAPDYVAACLVSRGEIVGVDVTTNMVVDLNGAAAGSAIELLGDNPASLTPDFANGRVLVTDSGCYPVSAADGGTDGGSDAGVDGGAPARLGRGIESVALATGSDAWLYQTTDLARLSGIVWLDDTHAFVNAGSEWFTWNPTQSTLGSLVADFPQAPQYDGAGRIVGLSAAAPDAGSEAGLTWSVVAFDVATSALTTIAANPFESVDPPLTFGVSSALLR